MTKFKEWTLDDSTAIDVLVGGTPCQSFSVAGLRKGLEDPRGNLMLTYLAIANKYRPKWLVWENVPGVLSSNGGQDFASFLRGLGELGYGFAYRVLDAQYFGVAQRRRRVFVVGCLGNWRGAAAVLFERHSLSGHPAPSREARQEIAGTIGARIGRSIGAQDAACGHMISGTLYKGAPEKDAGGTGLIPWPPEIAPTLNAHFGDKQGLENQHINGGGGYIPSVAKCLITKTRLDMETETMIVLMDQGGGVMNILKDGTVGTLRSETHGHEPMIIQPIPIHDQATRHAGKHGDKQDGKGNGLGVGRPGDPMNTLTKGDRHAVAQPYSIMPMNSGKDYKARETDVAQPLMAGGPVGGNQGGDFIVQPIPLDLRNATRDPEKHDEINRQGIGVGEAGDPAHTLTTACVHGVAQPIGLDEEQNAVVDGFGTLKARTAGGGFEGSVMQTNMAVRRLTPTECERLQGFPDGYTNIPWRKKEESPDGPRYKALGNSMAVPVMHWIGKRITDAP